MQMSSHIPFGPPQGLKNWKFCLPHLMFWACPVEATARGSKEEGKSAASQVKLSDGAIFPSPPIISEVGVGHFFKASLANVELNSRED